MSGCPDVCCVDVLNSRKATLEDEMTVSTMKREAARLYELLAQAEAGTQISIYFFKGFGPKCPFIIVKQIQKVC